jgi:hypothetical protein
LKYPHIFLLPLIEYTIMRLSIDDLYRVQASDIPAVVDVITRAFLNDPGICFSYPNEKSRFRKTSYMWEMVLKDRMRYGEVYAPSPALEGVALWLRSEYWEMGAKRAFQALSLRKLLALGVGAKPGLILNSGSKKYGSFASEHPIY